MKQLLAFLFLIAICFPLNLHAQDPDDPCTDPADPCPIDNGVVLLIAASVVIAAKKAYDFNTSKNTILKLQ
ncbi:MAG: hypothetical protein ABL929_08910 [Ferruginibacter sp.]|nr:hypothetical protein [Ferruginibacter sp.]